MKKNTLFGYNFDSVNQAEAIERVSDLLIRGRMDGKSRYVATVNLDFLTQSLGFTSGIPRHPELDRCIKQASLVLADGMPLVWWSKWFGHALPGRVTGADLLPQICDKSASEGWKLYFVGGTTETLDQNRKTLEQLFPGIQIVGMEAPFVHTNGKEAIHSRKDDHDIISRIHNAGTDLLLLCLGCPKQELFFDRIRNQLQVPVSLGLGASLEFLCGVNSRAPHWMQSNGLEWLHRMFSDPGRLIKRYAKDALFFARKTLTLANIDGKKRKSKCDWILRKYSAKGNFRHLISAPDVIKDVPIDVLRAMHSERSLLDLSETTHISIRTLSNIHFLINRGTVRLLNVRKSLRKKLQELNFPIELACVSNSPSQLLDGIAHSRTEDDKIQLISPAGSIVGLRDILLKSLLQLGPNTTQIRLFLDCSLDMNQRDFLDILSALERFKRKGVDLVISVVSAGEKATLRAMSWNHDLILEQQDHMNFRPLKKSLLFQKGIAA